MRVLVTCVAVALLSSPVELLPPRPSPVVEAFNDAAICRDLNITAPEILLDACFGDIEAYLGNEMFPGNTVVIPEIGFPAEPGCLYTFMIVDLDVPAPFDPFWRSYLMALYVNLKISTSNPRGLELEPGCEVATYIPTSPIPGTGFHRYVLLVCKQADFIDTTDPNLVCFQKDRLNFLVADFMRKYSCIGPVAGNFFVAQFPTEEC